jgi:prepilin-type N-terminal cleavage/methylation domain-containing protein
MSNTKKMKSSIEAHCAQSGLSHRSYAAQAGFTLIEMMVAMTLFAVVVSIAAGGFVQALRTQRQTMALMAANDAMSFTVEQISREIRTGRDFSVANGGSELLFTNSKGQGVAYCFRDNTYSDPNAQNTVGRAVIDAPPASCAAAKTISADTVRVRDLNFQLLNDPLFPPRVTLVFAVSPKSEPGVKDAVYHLQSTVSARNF